ncbi:MAG: hypothetical protein NTU67_05270 [Gemmatimonadetes bacterium]|nr:hypothetical protein [Gemmatimonadota bacterium]
MTKRNTLAILAADSAAAAAWMETADALTRGLTHALGNRMFSVWSIGTALRERPSEPRWGEAFDGEMARLEALLQLFRSLELDGEGDLEPIALPDVMAVAVALLGQHVDVRSVPVELPAEASSGSAAGASAGASAHRAPAPVLARRGSLTQALLMLLTDAARESTDESVPIVVRYPATTAEVVSIELSRGPAASERGLESGLESGLERGLVRAAALLMAHAGGVVHTGASGRTLTLPELGAARQAARGGD